MPSVQLTPSLRLLALVVASLVAVSNCLPVGDQELDSVTTSEPFASSVVPTIVTDVADPAAIAIKRAKAALESLNDQVKKSLATSEPLEATTRSETIGSYAAEAEVSDEPREQKFSVVLRDLEELEGHVQDTIKNLTATRQFAYGAMLRPMVTNIQQLRQNLTLLRNRMVGIVALNTIGQQVNSLQSDIGEALNGLDVASDATLMNALQEEGELKDLQDSLGWVTD